ncbi:MAG: ATP-binding cassette domain-containing protein, partial [Alphaproteobacteria bacterium]|nr:ATP-binding cassette domain-containing protein [Alphaproteobacteria bacterium]
YMASLRGLPKSSVKTAAQTANINEVMKQKNETLSKGYQRRVGFAQSILHNPPILLLDEPIDGLDPNQKDYMRRLIKDMSQNKTIVISTHLLEEAESVCNRIIVLDKGFVRADGDLKQILKQTGCKNLSESFRVLTKQEA